LNRKEGLTGTEAASLAWVNKCSKASEAGSKVFVPDPVELFVKYGRGKDAEEGLDWWENMYATKVLE
jgi:hypothetical protein